MEGVSSYSSAILTTPSSLSTPHNWNSCQQIYSLLISVFFTTDSLTIIHFLMIYLLPLLNCGNFDIIVHDTSNTLTTWFLSLFWKTFWPSHTSCELLVTPNGGRIHTPALKHGILTTKRDACQLGFGELLSLLVVMLPTSAHLIPGHPLALAPLMTITHTFDFIWQLLTDYHPWPFLI